MKNKIAKICSAIAATVAACVMAVSCSAAPAVVTTLKTFGEFTYGAHALTQFALEVITADQAVEMVNTNQNRFVQESGVSTSAAKAAARDGEAMDNPVNPGDIAEIKPCKEMEEILCAKYANITVRTKYYEDGSDVQQVKTDELIGGNLTSTIKENKFSPFSQLVARHLYVYEELITFMEEENAKFKQLDNYNDYPFTSVFTYHRDADGNLVIQTRDFSEIATNVGGGIGCSYRQDTEILYDSQNKISKWQTSLGVISATPNGTVRQGYILEMEFEWTEKV